MSQPPRDALDRAAQAYPRAMTALVRARDARTEMQALWGKCLDSDAFALDVVTSTDGIVEIQSVAAWSEQERRALTDVFRRVVSHLWEALDALVQESVEALSVLHRVRRPEAARYFPVADSRDGFGELLTAGCLDGVIRTQVQMVADCQPFHSDPTTDDRLATLRRGLTLLLAWENQLEAGAQLDGWATPGDPRVFVEPPASAGEVRVAQAGPVGSQRVLAECTLENYVAGMAVTAQADTYVDVSVPGPTDPGQTGERFDRQVELAIQVVTEFVATFAMLDAKVPGRRRVASAAAPHPIVDGSGRQDREFGTTDARQGGRDDGTPERRLILVNDRGVFERHVPAASPLRHHDRRGRAAETATQDAAATWGLPDFVMSPLVERKGKGVREISDGLLLAGDVGAIVQVKAREVAPAAADRESRWILKNIQAAAKQVDGTARRLKAAPATMVNGRGRDLTVDGTKVTWVGAIVIEHPEPPENLDIPAAEASTPWVALLRQEWEFLFDQLRSTRAVIDYLLRVAELPAVALGEEAFRYYDLAAADEDAPPGPVPPFLAGLGQRVTVPLLPSVPGYEEDTAGFELFRFILEDVATSPIEPEHELTRQRALGSLDGIPVVQRASLGRLLLDFLAESRGVDDARTIWKFRTYAADVNADQIGFGVCSQLSDFTNAAFRRWLILRHHERCVRLSTTDLTSMGVLLTPRPDSATEWDTTLAIATGDFQLSQEDVDALYRIWPPQGAAANR